MVSELEEDSVDFEQELHDELISVYRRTGLATGYWPHYFLRAVRKDGGLVVARKLLAPGQASSGFGRLIEARRVDLSVEYIAMSERFAPLFTTTELEVAKDRLDNLPHWAFPKPRDSESFPTEVQESENYREGSVRRITVNWYERNPKARAACISYRGAQCFSCDLKFEERYGAIGRGYIHVHHLRPLSRLSEAYKLDPRKDLVPVCPNCHAMLHRRDPPLDVEQLRAILRSASGNSCANV